MAQKVETLAENRRRISVEITTALGFNGLHPTAKAVTEILIQMERASLQVGIDFVKALSDRKMLIPSVLTKENLDDPGWRDIERRTVNLKPPRTETIEDNRRITAYDIREPQDIKYRRQLGGNLSLEVVSKYSDKEGHHIPDFTKWELKWVPEDLNDGLEVPLIRSSAGSTPDFDGRPKSPSLIRYSEKRKPRRGKELSIPNLVAGYVFDREWDQIGILNQSEDGTLTACFHGRGAVNVAIPESQIGSRYILGGNNQTG